MFHEKPSNCLVTTFQVSDQDVHIFGIVEIDQQGAIASFLEKSEPTATKIRSACPCFYLFNEEVGMSLLGLIAFKW